MIQDGECGETDERPIARDRVRLGTMSREFRGNIKRTINFGQNPLKGVNGVAENAMKTWVLPGVGEIGSGGAEGSFILRTALTHNTFCGTRAPKLTLQNRFKYSGIRLGQIVCVRKCT